MSETLVIFVETAGPEWLRVNDGAVISRGSFDSGQGNRLAVAEGKSVALVVPSEAVALHWVELSQSLSEPQAIAAARLACTGLTSQSMDDMHVAVGKPTAGGRRIAALVAKSQMAAWLAESRALGLAPDIMIPDVLLLPHKADQLARYDRNGIALVRGEEQAFAIEADVAEFVLDKARPVDLLGPGEFEAGAASALGSPAMNLLQGEFFRRRGWKPDPRWLRRMAIMAGLLLLLTFAVEITTTVRYSFAADRLEAQRDAVLRRAIGGEMPANSSAAIMNARLRQMGSGKGEFDRLVEGLFNAIQPSTGVELTELEYSEGGLLHAIIAGSVASEVAGVSARLEKTGMLANAESFETSDRHPAVRLAIRIQ